VVTEVLDAGESVHSPISGHIVLMDATQLRRGLGMLAQVLQRERPTLAVLTFADELARRGGSVDVDALSRAAGVRVLPVVAGDRRGVDALSEAFTEVGSWGPENSPTSCAMACAVVSIVEVSAWRTSVARTWPASPVTTACNCPGTTFTPTNRAASSTTTSGRAGRPSCFAGVGRRSWRIPAATSGVVSLVIEPELRPVRWATPTRAMGPWRNTVCTTSREVGSMELRITGVFPPDTRHDDVSDNSLLTW